MNTRTFLKTVTVASSAAVALPGVGVQGADLLLPYRKQLVFVGTYTGAKSKGIHAFRLDATSGQLDPLGVVAETPSPSFVALHPDGRHLYAAGEVGEFRGKASGVITAFSIDRETARLTKLNEVASGGAAPCHVSVDKTGRVVMAANYTGGSVISFPVKPDGSLGEAASFIQHAGSSVNKARQGEPHAHSINPSPSSKLAVAADLGTDQVFVYRLDGATAMLTPNKFPFVRLKPGSGPRHTAFHPKGRYLYVINEMLCTVAVFAWEQDLGELVEVQTVSTLPDGESVRPEYSTAEVQVHASGRFLYGSNRGHNTIAAFKVDGDKGTLTPIGHFPTGGRTPRNFGIDPSGRWLLAANQDSDGITVFRIDKGSGKLEDTGRKLQVGSPVCVKFLPVD